MHPAAGASNCSIMEQSGTECESSPSQSNELVFDDVEKDVEMDALSEEDPKGGYGEGEDVEMDEVEKVS